MADITLARPKTLLIPSLSVFNVISREQYFDTFKSKYEIDSVAIPLIEASGVFFPYDIDGKHRVGESIEEEGTADKELLQLPDVVRFFLAQGLEIYLTIEASLPNLPIVSGACDLVDQVGKRAAHCCINNPLTQKYLGHLVAEAVKLVNDDLGDQLRGIILYVNDFWPMSAQTGRFLLTCFCKHCVKSLRSLTREKLDPNWFRGFPNAANLALAETTVEEDDGSLLGGISSVNDLRTGMDTEEILEACSQLRGTQPALAYDKGTFETQRPQFGRWARQLKLYIEAKSTMTLQAVKGIFDLARQELPNARRIAIVEEQSYDWTSGIFLESLGPSILDEIWIPIPSGSIPDIPARALLARRACYSVNTFFSHLHTYTNAHLRAAIWTTMPEKSRRTRLRRSAEMAVAEIQRGEGDALLPETMTHNPDAIVVGLDEEHVHALVEAADKHV